MIRVMLGGTKTGSMQWAGIAGESIGIDQPLRQLEPFTIPSQGAADMAAPFVLEKPERMGTPIRAWVANAWRAVTRSAAGREGITIDIEGIGGFAIRADGGAITYQGDGGNRADDALVGEAVLGPALTLALAIKGTYCWHASGVLIEGGVVALMGVSGAGKSTLAGYLAKHGDRWVRVSDDVLPIRAGAGGAMALPHFPQLKLGNDQQAGRDVPEEAPISGVYVIEAVRTDNAAKVETMAAREAVSALVEHTLATSLFDAGMLAAHLEVCTAVVSQVAVQRLTYPHVPGSLPEALNLLKV